MKTPLHSPPSAAWLVSFLLCLTLDWRPAYARDFTAQEVRSAVQTWVRLVTTDPRPEAEIESFQPHAVDGRTVATSPT